MQIRTTIVLSESTRERLRRFAAERRQSMGEIIREAIEEKLARTQPNPKAVGIFASGYTDTAEQAGEMEFEPLSWRS